MCLETLLPLPFAPAKRQLEFTLTNTERKVTGEVKIASPMPDHGPGARYPSVGRCLRAKSKPFHFPGSLAVHRSDRVAQAACLSSRADDNAQGVDARNASRHKTQKVLSVNGAQLAFGSVCSAQHFYCHSRVSFAIQKAILN